MYQLSVMRLLRILWLMRLLRYATLQMVVSIGLETLDIWIQPLVLSSPGMNGTGKYHFSCLCRMSRHLYLIMQAFYK